MNKKKIVAIALSTAMLGGCLTGCSLTYNDTERDMAQTVAEIDITKSEDFKAGGAYEKYAAAEVVKPLTVTKRELVSYFINSGSSYISNGMSYEETFNILLNSMVNYKILIQYSMVYLFENCDEYTVEAYKDYVGNAEGYEYSLKSLGYFLQDKPYDTYTRAEKAEYSLKSSINSAIDSAENRYVASLDDSSSSSSGDARTTPDGIDTEKDEFFDGNYAIYTGFNSLTACGTYEKVSGGTKSTRQKAYNSFLKTLSRNSLLSDSEIEQATKGDGDLSSLNYYKTELISQYQSALSEKLSDVLEEKAEGEVTNEYLGEKFTALFDTQRASYDKSVSGFESALDSMSDSSFVLYCPTDELKDETDNTQYGFVYNILLPFSSVQSYTLTQYKNDTGLSDSQRYEKRAQLLEQIEAKDQRESWFNGATDYSYVAEDAWTGGVTKSNYLFFEDSLTDNDRYEKIGKYYGHYPYNGTVEYDYDNNEYDLTPNKLNITDFLTEMESYMNWALEREGYSNRAAALTNNTYKLLDSSVTVGANGQATTYATNSYLNADGDVDYSKFVYYVGQVGGLAGNVNAKTMFVEDNPAYTAMSAFNELQFAYSTDTGCLNKYMGYSVSRYTTSYVGEFEFAAKLAISLGEGTYTVCPSDYGWHIIYCTYAFDQSEVYGAAGDMNWNDKEKKGTFEYNFYESIKSSLTSGYQNVIQSAAVNAYNTDDCVKIYKNRYSDYTSLKNNTSSSSNNNA